MARNRPEALRILALLLVVVAGTTVAAAAPATGEPLRSTDGDRSAASIQQSPAFSVSGLQAPAQATVGQKVTATATVTNTGDAEGTETIQYRIAGQVIATTTVTLAAGESVAVTLEGTVPSLSTGTYQQGVFLGDSGDGQTAGIVIGSPAATFAVLSLQAPPEASVGDNVTATATIENTGDAEGTETFQYRIGGQVVASREVTLAAGARRTLSLRGAVPSLAAGTYRQGVFVNDTNSGLTTSLTITSPQASFAVSSLQVPSRAQAGSGVDARATVQNTGNARGSTTLQYRIDGTVVATREVTLDPGQRRAVTLSGTVPDRRSGTYRQGVFVGATNNGLTNNLVIDEAPAAYFRVSNLRAPSTAIAGSETTITARIRNDGSRRATVPIEYRIGNRVVGRQRVELRPGRSTTVEFDVTIPNLARGTYTQGVFVDDTARGQTTSLRVWEGPQISVTNLRAPPSARVGDRIAAEVTVRNRGDTRGTRTVEYRIGNRRVASRDVTLDAGDRKTVTLEGTVPDVAPGTYRQGAFIEGRGPTTALGVSARPAPRAAFSVASLDAPTQASAGGQVTATATVANTGDAAGTVTVEYRIDGRTVASRRVTIDAGAERDVRFDATVPNLSAGTYQHGVFVAGTVQGRTADVRITAGAARFGVSNLQAPASGAAGDQIEVRATVTNTGTARGGTQVQYRFGDARVASQSVELDPGASTTITFEATVPDRSPGTYRHGVFVGEGDRGQTSSFVIGAVETPTPRVVTRTVVRTPRAETETPGQDGLGFVIAIVGLLTAAMLAARRRRGG